jgi:hypothetical protein
MSDEIASAGAATFVVTSVSRPPDDIVVLVALFVSTNSLPPRIVRPELSNPESTLPIPDRIPDIWVFPQDYLLRRANYPGYDSLE